MQQVNYVDNNGEVHRIIGATNANEIVGVGDPSTLTTTAKTIVPAINELNTNLNTFDAKLLDKIKYVDDNGNVTTTLLARFNARSVNFTNGKATIPITTTRTLTSFAMPVILADTATLAITGCVVNQTAKSISLSLENTGYTGSIRVGILYFEL